MPPFERFRVLIADAGEFTVRVTPGEEGLGLSHLSELACSQREFIEQAITQALERGWKRNAECIAQFKRAHTALFYIGNLSHCAWEDPKNLRAVCQSIENYAKNMQAELEAAGLLPSAPLSEGVR